jgi:hypothetical protein
MIFIPFGSRKRQNFQDIKRMRAYKADQIPPFTIEKKNKCSVSQSGGFDPFYTHGH